MEEVRAQPLPFHPLKWVALFTEPPIDRLDLGILSVKPMSAEIPLT